jgi:membrane fusion protein (multidrug efflux system)
MKNFKAAIWVMVSAVVVIGLAVPKLMESKKFQPLKATAPGGQRNAKVAVKVQVLAPQKLAETIVAPGNVIADEQIDLKNEVVGRVVKLSLQEGSRVKRGELLVKLNDADLQAQRAKAEAVLTLAQERERRQKQLSQKGVISAEDYDAAAKELTAAQADIALLAAQIEKTEIRAPFDGFIGLRYVSEGEYLAAGTRIASLISTKPLKIEFAVPERNFGRISKGQVISFTVPGIAKKFNAAIFAWEPAIDEGTRTVRVRAVCRERDERLAPGAFAEVEIAVGANAEAIMVPSEALVPDARGQNVYLARGGSAVLAPVTIGVRDNAGVEILSGLQKGDSVIVSGVMLLRPRIGIEITNSL